MALEAAYIVKLRATALANAAAGVLAHGPKAADELPPENAHRKNLLSALHVLDLAQYASDEELQGNDHLRGVLGILGVQKPGEDK